MLLQTYKRFIVKDKLIISGPAKWMSKWGKAGEGSGHGTLKIIVGHHRGRQETFSNSRRSTIAKTITF